MVRRAARGPRPTHGVRPSLAVDLELDAAPGGASSHTAHNDRCSVRV